MPASSQPAASREPVASVAASMDPPSRDAGDEFGFDDLMSDVEGGDDVQPGTGAVPSMDFMDTCRSCGVESKNARWGSFKKVGSGNNALKIPCGGSCLNCVVTANVGFPDMTIDEIVEKKASDKKFKAKFDKCSAKCKVLADQGVFDDIAGGSEVNTSAKVGLEVEVCGWVLTEGEFAAVFKASHDKVEGVAVVQWPNEEGVYSNFVFIRDCFGDPWPEHLRCKEFVGRRARLFWKQEQCYVEKIMNKEMMLHKEQGQHSFNWLKQSKLDSRDKRLRAGVFQKLPTVSDVTSAVEGYQTKLAEQQRQALAAQALQARADQLRAAQPVPEPMELEEEDEEDDSTPFSLSSGIPQDAPRAKAKAKVDGKGGKGKGRKGKGRGKTATPATARVRPAASEADERPRQRPRRTSDVAVLDLSSAPRDRDDVGSAISDLPGDLASDQASATSADWESRLDPQAFHDGELDKRTLHQGRRVQASLERKGDSVKASMIATKLRVCECALMLHPQNIKAVGDAALEAAFRECLEAEVSLSAATLHKICSRRSELALTNHDIEKYLEVFMPWTTTDEENEDGVVFNQPKMRFAAPSNEAEIRSFAENIQTLFYTNYLISGMKGGMVREVLQIATGIVSSYLERREYIDKYADEVKESIAEIIKVCRCLIALAHPVPGELGSGPDDVKFVCDYKMRRGDKASPLAAVKDSLRVGEKWATFLDRYWEVASSENTYGPQLNQYLDAMVSSPDTSLAQVVEGLAELKNNLRGGATLKLEGLITGELRKQANDILAMETPNHDSMKAIIGQMRRIHDITGNAVLLESVRQIELKHSKIDVAIKKDAFMTDVQTFTDWAKNFEADGASAELGVSTVVKDVKALPLDDSIIVNVEAAFATGLNAVASFADCDEVPVPLVQTSTSMLLACLDYLLKQNVTPQAMNELKEKKSVATVMTKYVMHGAELQNIVSKIRADYGPTAQDRKAATIDQDSLKQLNLHFGETSRLRSSLEERFKSEQDVVAKGMFGESFVKEDAFFLTDADLLRNEECEKKAIKLYEDLKPLTSDLDKMAHGGADGASWHDAIDDKGSLESILTAFSSPGGLKSLKGTMLDSRCAALWEAKKKADDAIKSLDATLSEEMTEAGGEMTKLMERARVTKYEALLCLCLSSATKKKERCKKVFEQIANEKQPPVGKPLFLEALWEAARTAASV
eukprot:TRINITY_DN113506_c0_g1_i1.p1 TRINITY_DN113506_c0_g1~~TRINITY_DN113506_c0_g1_i1.p1  ORF type:complete len:1195 (+),score=339.19 TRINITY_DN113506_c0_g1_i1:94-3678(+)